MKKIPLTKGHVALIDDEDFERISAFKWSALITKTRNTTVVYGIRGAPGNKHVLLHRFIMNAPPGVMVDHRDNDGLNRQKHNMRLATGSRNNANGGRAPGHCGYRGVYIIKGRNSGSSPR